MYTLVKRQAGLFLMLVLLVPLVAACGNTTPTTSSPTAGATGGAAATTDTAAAPTEMMEPTMAADEPTMAAEEPTAATGGTTATSAAAVEAVELPEVDPASVTGDFVAAGSSTVFPLAERMAERFREDGYAGNPVIESIGSGAGFERFCNGESDIANASRAIKDEEVEACRANNIEPIEFRVGTDALTVVVSNENDFVEELTIEQLNQIFSGEAKTWQDVDPSFEAQPIQLFSPGSDSGTFDYFAEVVFEEDYDADKEQAYAKILKAEGIQLSEDDNVLVQGVQGSPYAIGYFGYAYFSENQSSLKAVSIDGVEPTAETAENGEYPISRPLFIYSTADIMNEKPQVAAFVNYFLTNVNDEIEDVGYFQASDQALNDARDAFLSAVNA